MFRRLLYNFSRSIEAKLSVLVAASVASAVLLGAVTSAWREADRQFAATSVELDGIAKALAATVAAPLAAKDAQNIGRVLTAIGRIPKINFAQVLDSEGHSLFQFGNGVILEAAGKPARANEDLSLYSKLNLRNHIVETPVISGGLEVGTLRIIADLSELRSALAESILAALLTALIAASAGFLVAGRLQRAIVYPINDLTSAMQDVQRSHDFSRIVPKQTDDETGLMVDAFNDMLAQIRVRDARIARQIENLEQEVENRTSELNLAKIAAESANASKSDFLATMSHEIRTPLNGIMVTAELMSTSDLPPQLQRHADTIVSSGQSLLTIINDILDLSKIEAGRMDLEAVPVEPSKLINQVLALFAARAASKGIDVAGYVAPDVPRSVSADPVRLTQVLSNLVNNALKFTTEGSVSIELQLNAEQPATANGATAMTFRVIDTGIGIAADKLDHIFEAFSQADRSTTRMFGGTGIGLSISRRLVAAMGGEIAVTSEVGAGSCFYFTIALPVLETAAPAESSKSSGSIVVDLPDSATRHALVRMLANSGIAITTPESVEMSIGARIATNPLAVITTPERLAQRQMSNSSPTDTPASARGFTVLVANIGDSSAIDMIDAGHADHAIFKPVALADIAELSEVLAHGQGKASPRVKPATREKAALPKFPGINVLAAEDSAVNRQILAEALSRLDVRVTLVEDGQQAVNAVSTGHFDLVLMDCSMPVMDGFDATRAIRAREADMSLPALPIVALTAHVTGSQATAWRGAGMSDYISKPFTLKSLASCLERWLVAAEPTHDAAPADTTQTMPANPAAPQFAILNPEVIDGIRDMQAGGDDLVGRIFRLFRLHAPAGLDRISAALETGEMPAIASAAHALKSLCRNIGAERLAATLDDLEEAARANKDLPAHANLCGLREQLAEVIAALDAISAAAPDLAQSRVALRA